MATIEPSGKYKLDKKERARVLSQFRKALELKDKKLFEKAIQNDLGLQPGTLEYARCLVIWNDFHSSQK